MHVPKLDDLELEKYALLSSTPVAPTVIAPVTEAGDDMQASESEFPPATTTTTPAATALLTAVLIDSITTIGLSGGHIRHKPVDASNNRGHVTGSRVIKNLDRY
jgi:hypothetical protein